MGLNISIYVKEQRTGYGEEGQNPQGTPEEVQARFFEFLRNKFPEGGFGGGGVSHSDGGSAWPFDGKPYWQFNVRMFRYGSEFEKHYKQMDMWLAMTEFVYLSFSHHEGIEMITSWGG